MSVHYHSDKCIKKHDISLSRAYLWKYDGTGWEFHHTNQVSLENRTPNTNASICINMTILYHVFVQCHKLFRFSSLIVLIKRISVYKKRWLKNQNVNCLPPLKTNICSDKKWSHQIYWRVCKFELSIYI